MLEFNLSYGVLFKCTIFHYFYLDRGTSAFATMTPTDQANQLSKYNVPGFMDIVPSENCNQALTNNKLIFKEQTDGFSIVSQLDTADKSKTYYLLDDLLLTFYLIQKNPYFYNATTLTLSNNNDKIYYFSNRSGLAGSGYPTLSLPYQAYVAGSDYEMGSLVSFGGNDYEAIKSMINSTVNPDVPGSGWQINTNNFYVSISDRIPLYYQFIPFTLPADNMSVTLQIKDILGNIVQTSSDSSLDHILSRKLSVQFMKSGHYTLVITNNADSSIILTQELYIINEFPGDQIFGVIEVSGDSLLGDYRLTDNNRTLNNANFSLHFKNRSTIWRYLNMVDRSILLESGPNPNTSQGFVSVLLNGNELPNPSVNVIKPESDKIVSEIFIST